MIPTAVRAAVGEESARRMKQRSTLTPRWFRSIAHIARAPEIVRCVAHVHTWAGLARRYLGLGGGFPFVFKTRAGVKLYLETYHDVVTAWVIFCRREYRLSSHARLVVDLGANVGMFAIHAATHAEQAAVVAFEPYPSTFDHLIRHVALNGLEGRISCHAVAIGATPGMRHMGTDGPSQSRGLLPNGEVLNSGALQVQVQTLAQILSEVRESSRLPVVDFLKIDVEGAEHEVLHGLDQGTLDGVLAIAIEYHPNGVKASLFSVLRIHGFVPTCDKSFGKNVGVAHFKRAR